MKCAATLTVERNKVHVGSFRFFVKKKKKETNGQQHKKKTNKTKQPRNQSPLHHHTTLPLLWEFSVWYVSSYKVLASAEHSLK